VPRRPSATLTDAELRLMNVLWSKQRATVGEVAQALRGAPRLAYNTVLTTLRILEQKGCVAHEKEGRAFVYVPVLGQRDARRQAIRHLIGRFFDNSPKLLLLNALSEADVDPETVRHLKSLLAEEPVEPKDESQE
jgi:predicted transcriptional regulator